MAIDLSKKRVPVTDTIRVKNADGSLMSDDQGNPAYVRIHTPASKVWENANAALRRKAMKRVRENGGKIEASTEEPEDILEYLVSITEEFINLDHPDAGEQGGKSLVRAIFEDPELGFIRDQLYGESKDWGSFTSGSAID